MNCSVMIGEFPIARCGEATLRLVAMYKLGTGILNWNRTERVSNRYGTVHLYTALDSEEMVALNRVQKGTRGRIIAVVEETRQSRHLGDLFNKVFPRTPTVGQHITLGEGSLFFAEQAVGLIPTDERMVDAPWLDVRSLYDAHEQTVSLYFEEIAE